MPYIRVPVVMCCQSRICFHVFTLISRNSVLTATSEELYAGDLCDNIGLVMAHLLSGIVGGIGCSSSHGFRARLVQLPITLHLVQHSSQAMNRYSL